MSKFLFCIQCTFVHKLIGTITESITFLLGTGAFRKLVFVGKSSSFLSWVLSALWEKDCSWLCWGQSLISPVLTNLVFEAGWQVPVITKVLPSFTRLIMSWVWCSSAVSSPSITWRLILPRCYVVTPHLLLRLWTPHNGTLPTSTPPTYGKISTSESGDLFLNLSSWGNKC